MIGSLRGVLLDRRTRGDHIGEVLVEVAGVGYRVIVPAGALARLGEPGAQVFLHVHTHVREDAMDLYGFPSRDERNCFEVLIGAHGVGPTVALALLSVHSPAGLRRAIACEDIDALVLVPGIGKRTAERLLLELKSRLDAEPDDDSPALALVGAGANSKADARAEVRAALASLGYGADEIRQALRAADKASTVEDMIRQALRALQEPAASR